MAAGDVAGRGTAQTFLNEGGLVLVPAPTNATDDAIDGLVTIGQAHATSPRFTPGSVTALDRAIDSLAPQDLRAVRAAVASSRVQTSGAARP